MLMRMAILWANKIQLSADSQAWHYVRHGRITHDEETMLAVTLFQCPRIRILRLLAMDYIYFQVQSQYMISKCVSAFQSNALPLQQVKDVQVFGMGGEDLVLTNSDQTIRLSSPPMLRNKGFSFPNPMPVNFSMASVRSVRLGYTNVPDAYVVCLLTSTSLGGYLSGFVNFTELCFIYGHAHAWTDSQELGTTLVQHVPQVKRLVLAVRFPLEGSNNDGPLLGNISALQSLEDLTISLDIITAFRDGGVELDEDSDADSNANNTLAVHSLKTQRLDTTLPTSLRKLSIIDIVIEDDDMSYEGINKALLIKDIGSFMKEDTSHSALVDITLGIKTLERELPSRSAYVRHVALPSRSSTDGMRLDDLHAGKQDGELNFDLYLKATWLHNREDARAIQLDLQRRHYVLEIALLFWIWKDLRRVSHHASEEVLPQ